MDEYEELANQIIDGISEYIENAYGISYKNIKKKYWTKDETNPIEGRGLIYGNDYYDMETDIAGEIERLVRKKMRKRRIK